VVRSVDARRSSLAYLICSHRVIEGSPLNSVSVVAAGGCGKPDSGALSSRAFAAHAVPIEIARSKTHAATRQGHHGQGGEGGRQHRVHIARARRVTGDEHDSTVKFRPVDPAEIGNQWRKFRDFKIEVDASEKAMVKSASFSMPVDKGLIKRVAGGKQPIDAVFTAEQEEFLMTVAKRKIDFTKLAVLGPLLAQRWSFEDPSCPWLITAELWRREDGRQLMEVSIKAPIVQAAVAIGGFMAYLAEVGAERDDSEQTKTRWALAYYAAKLTPAQAAGATRATVAGKARTRKAPAKKTPDVAPQKMAAPASARARERG
jgi:hypothetical protein